MKKLDELVYRIAIIAPLIVAIVSAAVDGIMYKIYLILVAIFFAIVAFTVYLLETVNLFYQYIKDRR